MTLNEAKKLEHSPDPIAREDAKRRLAYAARQKAMRKSRRSRAPGPTKEERKAARNAQTAIIRSDVDARDDVCVICLEPAPEPWELHHVDSGNGKSQRQSVRNCAKTHEGCHKAAHRGAPAALNALLRWARFHGYTETEAVILHRIAKVEEARRASGGTP